MKIRPVYPDDMLNIEKIYNTYYSEFEFPDFSKFLINFIIEDNFGNIVLTGGLEPKVEAILLTDKSKNVVTIGRALKEAQMISMHVARKYEMDEVLAFVTEPDYAKHLIKHGFHPRQEIALKLRVTHG